MRSITGDNVHAHGPRAAGSESALREVLEDRGGLEAFAVIGIDVLEGDAAVRGDDERARHRQLGRRVAVVLGEIDAEAAARQKLADAEAYRVAQVGKANAGQMATEGALLTKHPLLVQKAMADKLSDKVQVIIAPPGSGGFIGNAVMGVLFGLVYLRTKRVMPLVICHALLDIFAFVGYTLLKPYIAWL